MKKNILVVEYDNTAVDTLKEILVHPIFDITVVEEGQLAKEILQKQGFDLVITAAMLPKFHGFNLSQYIKENFPQTSVVIISSIYKEIEYKHQAITQYKADDFIEKPLKAEAFKKRIFEILGIRDSDLSETAGPTTTQMPVIDTAKIPTIKKLEEEESKFTSDDLFGDIIQKIDHSQDYEIKLEEENHPGKKNKEFQELDEIVLPESYLVDKPEKAKKKETEESASQIIDKSLVNIFQKEDKAKDTTRLKKIEDDISKKFEETLSGLGIKSKAKSTGEVHPRRAETVKVDTVKSVEEAAAKDEFGNYDLLGLIARGGMAEIYKAKKKGVKGFEKVIAVKKILSGYGEDDKFIEMFVDEAKIAAELTHPNIVQIYDLGKKDDSYFIAMEYVEGKDLRNILRKMDETNQVFPEEVAVHLVIKILEALSYAHSAKDSQGRNLDIVHRDVSPPNILISFGGEVKLTDFGVSKAAIKMHQTISGALKGKLLYMSPEQANAEKDVDYRSDLYSAGVILFELITGKKLFMDSSEMGILKKVQNGVIPKPGELREGLEPELERIILKALEKEVDKRYQNAAAIVKDLEAYLQQNFDHIPGAIHMAHFLYKIFREEIASEGIKIDLKPLPYSIRRKPAEIVPPTHVPEAEEAVEEVKQGAADTQEIEETEDVDESPFETTIEIDLEASEKVKPDQEIIIPLPGEEEVEPSFQTEPGKLPEMDIESEIESLRKEDRKKSHIWLWLIILVVVVLIAGGLYLQNRYNLFGDIFGGVKTSPPAAVTDVPGQAPKDTSLEPEKPEENVDTSTEELAPSISDESSPQEQVSTDSSRPQKSELESQPSKTKAGPETEIAAPEKKVAEEKVKVTPVPEKKIEQPRQEKTSPLETKPAEKEDSQTGKSDVTEEPPVEVPQDTVQPESQVEEKKTEPVSIKPVVREGMTVTDVDTQPVPVSTPLPKVSRKIARQIRRPQTVIISYLVDHTGKVEKIKFVQKSEISELNMLITSTIYTWKFEPALKDNKRVKIWLSKPLTFKK